MTALETSERMPFSAEHLFNVASDVASYPSFVPLCVSAEILRSEVIDSSRSQFSARLDVAYPPLGIAESFVSEVFADRRERLVEAVSEEGEGAVKSLRNRWRFKPHGDEACDVAFLVDYRMRSRFLQVAADAMLPLLSRKIAAAFADRARALINGGRGGVTPPQIEKKKK